MDNSLLSEEIKAWYKRNFEKPLKEITRELIVSASKNDLDKTIGALWGIFVRNSCSLFQIMLMKNFTNQVAMTSRLIMEYSADLKFISKYPQNIKDFKERKDDFLANDDRDVFSYYDLSKIACELELHKYDKKGEKKGFLSTRSRIEYAFKDKKAMDFYDFLNCYSHLNYLNIIWDTNTVQDDQATFSERMVMLSMYYDCFVMTVTALGELSRSSNLLTYDFSSIKKVMHELVENHSLI